MTYLSDSPTLSNKDPQAISNFSNQSMINRMLMAAAIIAPCFSMINTWQSQSLQTQLLQGNKRPKESNSLLEASSRSLTISLATIQQRPR
jgi:hypothetical protein